MSRKMIAILTSVIFLMPLRTFAEPTTTQKFSDPELVRILKDDGYQSVRKVRDGVIVIKVDGRAYVLVNLPDGDLQAYYAIGNATITYEDINEWNRTKRLSRAYLDSDRDPVLEADLLSNAGLTVRHVTEFFRVFKDSAQAVFRQFIVEHDKS